MYSALRKRVQLRPVRRVLRHNASAAKNGSWLCLLARPVQENKVLVDRAGPIQKSLTNSVGHNSAPIIRVGCRATD